MADARAARRRAPPRRGPGLGSDPDRRTRSRSWPTSSGGSGRCAARPPASAAHERQAELDAGVRPDFLAGDRASPRGRLDRRPGARRPRRPAGRDHRPGRAQDDDQRAQLGRPRVHGRPRGRAVADLGERRRWPGGAGRRGAPDADLRVARGQGLPARRRDRDAGRPAARLAPRRVGDARRRRPGLGQPVRLRAVPVPQRRRGAAAGERAVPLPRQARVAPRGAALERGLHPRPGRRSASRAGRSGRRS